MKNILVINTSGIGVGGITTHMLNYLKYIVDENVNIDIVATILMDDNMLDKFMEIGCNIIYMPNRKKQLYKYIRNLKSILANKKYDVVHVHGNSATMCIELGIAQNAGVSVRIAHCHNTECNHPIVHKLLYKYFSKTYTNALACSEEAGIWIFGKNSFSVLKNAIETDKYKFNVEKRNSIRKKYHISEDMQVIGNIGNMNQQKNQEFLIDLVSDIKNCKLWLIGIGENMNMLKQLVKKYNIENKVQFLGLVDNVGELMNAMDVFVLPSRWEGLPLVLIEAQTNGLPCVVSEYVSLESCIDSNNYYSLPLENEKWRYILKTLDSGDDRNGKYKIIEKEGYSIGTELIKLKRLYQIDGCNY